MRLPDIDLSYTISPELYDSFMKLQEVCGEVKTAFESLDETHFNKCFVAYTKLVAAMVAIEEAQP